MKTTLEVLIEAKALISDKAKWYQGAWCDPDDETKMCAIGAVRHACHGSPYSPSEERESAVTFPCTKAWVALDALAPAAVGNILKWNDAPGRTHAEIMDIFDRAIAAEQGK